MTIIIISESSDFSSLEVIRWLKFHQHEVFRINDSDKVSIIDLDINNKTVILEVDGDIVTIDHRSKIWYRRGKLNFTGTPVNQEIDKVQNWESVWLNDYIFRSLIDTISLGNFSKKNLNKLLVLNHAKACELIVPHTYVSSKRSHLQSFIDAKPTITKTIGTQLMYTIDNEIHLGYTETVISNDLMDVDETIFPSLLQEKIDKKFEIRSFFLKDEFFSMAIFSQNNEKTETDFRKYDADIPNRTIPFKLPSLIEERLKKLFFMLNLNTGSVDLILDRKGRYVFLEINPVGQFGMVSKPCNYYLEDKIAHCLANGTD